MSCAFSSSSLCAPGVARPPLPPPTNTVLFSGTVAISSFPASPLMNARSYGKDRQVQRDQYAAHKYRHDDEDNGLNQGHGGAQSGLYVLFVKLGHRIQHGR